MVETSLFTQTSAAYLAVRVQVVRFLSEEPQPGVVECEMVDALGRTWTFREKSAIVSCAQLQPGTSYPVPGVIACTEVARRVDGTGRTIVRVDTRVPWGVWSVDEVAEFDVVPSQLVRIVGATGRETPP